MSTWQWQIPEQFNIGEACIRPADDPASADKPAIIVDNEITGVSALTYAQLAQQVKRFAAFLQSGVTARGDRVLIQLPNCLPYPVGFLGAVYAGRVAVPASVLLTVEELVFLINDSGACLAVLDAELQPELDQIASSCPALRSIVWVNSSPHAVPVGPGVQSKVAAFHWKACVDGVQEASDHESTASEDPAYLVYTSGTTGYPKGLLHAHRALLGRMPASQYWFDFQGDNDRILHSGKFNWTYVLGTALMDPLSQGKTVVVYEGSVHADVWPALISKHGCTIFIGVPTLFRQILQKTSAGQETVPTLRHCMSAGEHLSDEVLAQWKHRFGREIYEAVGMSECSYYLSHHVGLPVRPGSAGKPQPGHEITLLDEHLQPVSIGKEGMICIPETDPGLFLEYWQLPEETAKSRSDGYFLTGDYARQDADGYFWFLGRKDDLINSFGYRISPVEVERVLKSHPAVADCAVVGQEVDKDKVIVVACVIAREGALVDESGILTFAAEHLAAYKLPKKVTFMAEFPRTRNGKVLRRQLINIE